MRLQGKIGVGFIVGGQKGALEGKTVQENGDDDESYLDQFRNLILDPAVFAEQRSLTFQDFMDWQRCFHILQPIVDEKYVRGLVARMRASGLPLVDTEVDKLFQGEEDVQPQKHVYKCTCSVYKQYAWCLEMAVQAAADGLVAAPFCPPTMNPTPILPCKRMFDGAQVGRPKKARPGEALGVRVARKGGRGGSGQGSGGRGKVSGGRGKGVGGVHKP